MDRNAPTKALKKNAVRSLKLVKSKKKKKNHVGTLHQLCLPLSYLFLDLQNFSDLGAWGTLYVQCFMKRLSWKAQAEVRRGSCRINKNL